MNNDKTQPITDKRQILTDSIFAIKSWRIWCYMGVQDLQNQFKRSQLGALWGLINLLLMASCIAYVYGHLFQQDLSTFFPYLILGVVLWNFIVSSLVHSCQAFIASEGYIKQFSFPKQLYIFRFFMTNFINLIMGLIISVLVTITISHQSHWYTGLGGMIIGLLLLTLICIGHITIFAYAGARYRDLGPALSGVSLMIFYITPIVFSTDMLQAKHLSFIYEYNPIYYLLEIVRYPLLHGAMADLKIYSIASAYGLFVWAIAVFTIVKNDHKVAYWL